MGAYGLIQDIHEKSAFYQQLALQEEQFRQTFDFAPIGMALVGLDGKWLRVNNAVCHLLGYTAEELHQLSFQDITHPEDLEADLALLNDVIEGRRTNYSMEKRYFHRNGAVIDALLSVSLMKDQAGKPMYFVSHINDITERKQLEIALKELLEVTQEQNTRLLNFAHIVSHNLRSHSGNIKMILNVTEEDAPELAQNEHFPYLRQASDSLMTTIEHLNDVVLMNNRISESLVSLNLLEYVEKCIVSIKGQVLEQQAEITNNVSPGIFVKAVPAYLESILLNILTNALKYRSAIRLPKIDILATTKERHALIHISDNGRGIDLLKNGSKLFGMYKTFHGNREARGVGLFITKNQVEAMGGTITVTSEVEEGSTFVIKLLR
jgi:PAS domain S-box-containing protein